jgi:hypothetical protein
MTLEISAALTDLATTLTKLKELAEWAKFECQEWRPSIPPSFQLSNHAGRELREEYGFFVKRALDIRQALHDPVLQATPVERDKWNSRFLQLERELQQLSPTETFISH